MRVLVGGISHETNTYATALWGTTELSDFNQSAGSDMLAKHRPARTCVGGMLAAAAELSIEVVPTYHAGASPGGTISEAAFAELKAQLMESLEGALRASDGDVSAVCLDLHGAGVYSEEHHHDLEAEVGRSVRALIGDDIPLVSTAACKRRFSLCCAFTRTALCRSAARLTCTGISATKWPAAST